MTVRAPTVTIFDRLGRWVHRRRWWVIGAWVVLLLIALPFAPRAPSALRAGGFTLDTLESARARALLEDELGLPPSALVLVYSSATEPAGSPAFEAAASAATAAVSSAPHVTSVVSHQLALDQVSTDRTTAYDVLILDLPPDDSPDALPGVRDAPGSPARRARDGGPRRRAGLLRGHPDGVGERPPAVGDRLAAAGGPDPAARLRLGGRGRGPAGGRRRGGLRLAGDHLGRRPGHPDERLRAEPRDPAGSGPGGRLLPADDESLPRGAASPKGAPSGRPAERRPRSGGHRGRDPDHGRHRRPGRLLLGADRAARADRADPVRLPDPPLGRGGRRDRRRDGGPRPHSPCCRRSWRCSGRVSTPCGSGGSTAATGATAAGPGWPGG